GAAEFIHGADERVLGHMGGGAAAIVSAVANGSWGGGSINYAGAYVATRYLHDKIKEAGGSGLKDLMQYMAEDTSRTLDQAIAATTNYAGKVTFMADFQANGANYITNNMDLTNADTGAIGGLDADGGGIVTAENVVDEQGHGYAEDPLESFNVTFAETYRNVASTRSMTFQVGAANGMTLDLEFGAIGVDALSLGNVDSSLFTGSIVGLADAAIEQVSAERAKYGALMNRLESTISTLQVEHENTSAARSRIVDVDYASETANLSANTIVRNAAQAMLAQANSQPNMVLSLLRPA
ncbi:MAG: flagellin, partial [Gammaproteobacteria bacterium]|nr:flagellin [Gammaproteobacteria bacterium]